MKKTQANGSGCYDFNTLIIHQLAQSKI